MKRCTKCGEVKDLDAFCKRNDRPCGRMAKCKRCQAADTMVYHHTWKAKLRLLKDRPCMDCGQKFPPCAMDFDHRDPSKKLFHFQIAKNWEATIAEIAKCDLVCANCHRIRTSIRCGSASAY